MKGKIMQSVISSILSFLTIAQAGVCAVGNEMPNSSSVSAATSKEKQKEKGFVSRNIGSLTAGAGLLAAMCIYLVTRESERESEYARLTKEQLIELLPDVWREFWVAWYAAGDARETAWKATEAASEAVRFAKSVRDADNEVAWKAARWVGRAAVADMDDARCAAWEAARDAARFDSDAAWEAAMVASDATRGAAWEVAWTASWRQGGAAYELVKEQGSPYFVNLLKILREYTNGLKKDIKKCQNANLFINTCEHKKNTLKG